MTTRQTRSRKDGRQPETGNQTLTPIQPRPSRTSARSSEPMITKEELQQVVVGLSMSLQNKSSLKHFTGKEDVLTWVEDFESLQAESYGWDESMMTKQVRSFLDDLALVWYKGEDKRSRLSTLSWTIVKDKLLEAFKPCTYELDQLVEFNRKQKKGEDVIRFLEDKVLIGSRMGRSNEQLIQQVISSLQPALYFKLAEKKIGTIEELRKKLRKLQTMDDQRVTSNDGKGDEDKPKRSMVECYNCKRLGHKANECRKPKGDNVYKWKAPGSREQGGRPWKFNDETRKKPMLTGANRTPMIQDKNEKVVKTNKIELTEYPSFVQEIFIGNTQIVGLIDTGADISVMDKKVYEALKRDTGVELMSDKDIALCGASGERLMVLGVVQVEVLHLENGETRRTQLKIVVVDNLTDKILLGKDFMHKSGKTIIERTNGEKVDVQPKIVEQGAKYSKEEHKTSSKGSEGAKRGMEEEESDEKGAEPPKKKGRNRKTVNETTIVKEEPDEKERKMAIKHENMSVKNEASGRILKAEKEAVSAKSVTNEKEHKMEAEHEEASRANAADRRAPKELALTRTVSAEAAFTVLLDTARKKVNESKREIVEDVPEENLCGIDEFMWGEPYEIPEGNFADDAKEDRDNPYINKEQVTTFNMQLDDGVEGDRNINIGISRTEKEKANLSKLLVKFVDVLAFNNELGDCAIAVHEIETDNAKPVHAAPFRRSVVERESVDKQVKTWMEQGVIRPSASPWASRVVTVKKKDNTLRCCIDYRALNAVTKRDQYPLPTREEIFASLSGMKYFSSLDLNQGYLQIRMNEVDVQKTAFVIQSGFYEFVRMPFGLTNAPATFQRLMDVVLGGLKWKCCLVYLDDIIIFGETLDAHNDNLEAVLGRIKGANLTIKPSKCAFAVEEIKFLGHILSQVGVKMDPDKVRAILDVPPPSSVHDVRSFIGMASYYRQFIQGFATIAAPLHELTKKSSDFCWTDQHQQAYESIRQKLTTEPILCHFDKDVPIQLRTDASGYGIGAILIHNYPEGERVIAYASRMLDSAEKRYGITEKEGLAVVWAVNKFHMYLQGVYFEIYTDHLALVYLNSKKEIKNQRLARWANLMQPYHCKIIYKKGRTNKDADYLSRYPVGLIDEKTIKDVHLNRVTNRHRGVNNPTAPERYEYQEESNDEHDTWSWDDVRLAQRDDPQWKDVIDNINETPGYALEEGLLVRIDAQDARADSVSKVVIPDSILAKVLYSLHDDPLCGHGGIEKTLWRFKQKYFAKNQTKKVKEYVKTCHLCQTKKAPWTSKVGLLHPLALMDRPFKRIGVDTMGPFKLTRWHNRKVIVITDYFTKYAIVKAVKTEKSEELSSILLTDVLLKHGSPEVILTDRGKNFNTQLMKNIYEEFDMRHVTSTAYHPQTLGLTERLNKTIGIMLSMYVNRNHRDWDEYIPYIEFAYNSCVQESTGYSPFYLLHGYEPRTPVDVHLSRTNSTVANHFERLEEARKMAIDNNRVAQRRQKECYDKGRYVRDYRIGDLVLVFRARGYIGQTTKLRHNWEGPWEVIRREGDNYVLVERNGNAERPREETVFVSRMKPYYRRYAEQVDVQEST